MRSKVIKLLVGLVIIALTVLSLGTYFLANQKIVDLESPRFLKKFENNLAVLFDNSIYLFNQNYQVVQTIDLNSLSIQAHGDFDFYSNGDLLVYHNEYQKTLIENLLTFIRAKQIKQAKPIGSDGFYRCKVLQKVCVRVAKNIPAINSSFRVTIDQSNNQIYLTDIARFRLYKLDEAGNKLESYENQLKFPNEIFLDGSEVVIANTNFHEVQLRSINTLSKIKSRYRVAYDRGYKWPAHVAKVDDGWWLVIANNAMRDGRVFQYKHDWSDSRELQLNGINDPGDLIYFNNRVLVTDWSNFKLGIFDKNGQPDNTRLDPDFQSLLDNQHAKAEALKQTKLYGIIGFALVLIFGFATAFILERKQP